MLPNTVQLNTSEAIVNQSFNATCLATGYPPPKVYIDLDCQPNTFTAPQPLQVDNYTMKGVISINEFPAKCSTIYCYSYPINCTETINHTVQVVTTPDDMHMECNTTNTTIVPTNTTIVLTSTPAAGAATKATNEMIMIILLIAIILLS